MGPLCIRGSSPPKVSTTYHKLFEPDTTIVTDFWNYGLTGVCMHNFTVNDGKSFVDPVTSANNQNCRLILVCSERS